MHTYTFQSVTLLFGLLLAWFTFTAVGSTTAAHGVLHTLPDFIEWHEKEEQLVHVLNQRLDSIRKYRHHVIILLSKQGLQLRFSNRKKLKTSESQENHESTRFHQNFFPRYELYRCRIIMRLLFWEQSTKSDDQLQQLLDLKSYGRRRPGLWIGYADKMYSSLGFVNIQLFYLQRPQETSHGLTLETFVGGTLNGVQCAEIGMFALTQTWLYMAVQWLEEGQREPKINFGIIPAFLSIAVQAHNGQGHKYEDVDFPTHRENIPWLPNDNIFNAPIQEHDVPADRVETALMNFQLYRGWGPHARVPEQGVDLCRGNLLQPPEVVARLKCYYEHKLDPFLYPGPIKTEVLSESPYIVQFYEVLSNSTINKMKMRHQRRVVPETDIYDALVMRTCGNHARHNLNLLWEPKELLQMSRILTGGLSPMEQERENMFGEYTYGRLYQFHVDHSSNRSGHKDEIEAVGERFATLLYYALLPQVGGYTPFMGAGVFARPELGSAVFWYSLFKNGTIRRDVSHGSCPVVYGSKISKLKIAHFADTFKLKECILI